MEPSNQAATASPFPRAAGENSATEVRLLTENGDLQLAASGYLRRAEMTPHSQEPVLHYVKNGEEAIGNTVRVEQQWAAQAMELGRRKVCVLSIDGGGMRGIIPAKVLCYLEDWLRARSGNSDARVADYFDVVAGTSVGGLIAVMLCGDDGHGRPLFSARQALEMITERGRHIFKVPLLRCPISAFRGIFTPRYSVKHMEELLKEHLVREDRRELTLKDTLKSLVIPCYDLARGRPHVFTRQDANISESRNYRLIDICRATSAVPGFFRPAIFSSVDGVTNLIGIDGGLVMNNPATAAITHVFHNEDEFSHVRTVDDLLVLSLGTGLFDRVYTPPKVSGLPGRFLTQMDDASSSNVNHLCKIADDMLDLPCFEYVPFFGRQQLDVSNRDRLHSFVDQLLAEHQSRLKSTELLTAGPEL
ncbi:hypothetical protein KP509_33G051600 [Ceratopteris richardii]|uniref:Patatin n=1 Tax=Ceratopteris richardii TaxID=49495 RepID=A0A8T2QPM1_CERRI|nr:hypothetical protein KP509_33G051600 [Ceratopteris richardii]